MILFIFHRDIFLSCRSTDACLEDIDSIYENIWREGLLWTWRRHQMETFSALLAICAGNHWSPVNSPHKGQWRGALMFSLISVWINGWVHNGEAGDLRRHRSHYDVIVMNRLLFMLAFHSSVKFWCAFLHSFTRLNCYDTTLDKIFIHSLNYSHFYHIIPSLAVIRQNWSNIWRLGTFEIFVWIRCKRFGCRWCFNVWNKLLNIPVI